MDGLISNMEFLDKELHKSPLFGLDGSDAIKSLQQQALEEFNRSGLPNKSWEDWKYSDFSLLNKIKLVYRYTLLQIF